MEDKFITSDLQLATVLSMKYPLIDIIFKGKKGEFCFNDSEELQEFVNLFWTKQLKVEPIDLFNSLKTLKNRLYGGNKL